MSTCNLCQMNFAPPKLLHSMVKYKLCNNCDTLIRRETRTTSDSFAGHQLLCPLLHASICKLLVHNFKYFRHLGHGRLLLSFLLNVLREHYAYAQYPDGVVTIPSHPARKQDRAFSQTAILGCWLSSAMDIPVWTPLRHTGDGVQQAGLSKNQRTLNVKNAFAICPKIADERFTYNGVPRKIAIIDDVVTTGATVEAAIAALKKHTPALEIDIWSLTHTP